MFGNAIRGPSGFTRVKARGSGFLQADGSSLPAGHHLTINVTDILTGCTLELELVAVIVIV